MHQRPIVFMIAEQISDVPQCAQIAAQLRRLGVITESPLKHISVKRQMKKATEANAYITVLVNGETSRIGYHNTPVKEDCLTSQVVAIIEEHENDYDISKDEAVNVIVNNLLDRHKTWQCRDSVVEFV